MTEKLAILQVEDSEDDALLILRALRKDGLEPNARRVEDEETLRSALQEKDWDIVLSDFSMPRFSGERALNLARTLRPELPFILVSGAVGEETAVRILHQGACDFVMKSNLERLAPAVRRALRETCERRAKEEAEQALRDSEIRFRTLVENIPGVVFRCALAAPRQASHMSAMVEEVTGYSSGDFLTGRIHLGDLIIEEDLDKIAAALPENAASDTTYAEEYRVRHKDGRIRWVYEKGRIVRSGKGAPLWLDGVIIDITARKAAEEERGRLEKQLRQAQKMEAIGTLAGGIAHDFNNILSAILGYAELLDHALRTGTQEKTYVHEVMKAGNRAKELVSQILTFSRISEKQRVRVNVATIVREALSLLRATIPTTIEIRHHFDPDCDAILADPTQIHQVLMNLCSNAAQAMEEKGGVLEVRVEASRIPAGELTGTAKSGSLPCVQLIVKDTGLGIAKELVERIFEPYFTTKAVGKGTGMGLAVVQGIVRNHGGFVRVESKEGEGVTFRVFFPAAGPSSGAKTPESGQALPAGHGRILFVDDEAMLIELGKTFLEQLGYQVTALLSSIEALECFRQDPARFDLVITDQTMPALPGTELAREILALRPDIPIFLCTGYSSVVDEKKAKSMGIRTFLMKPFDLPALANAVHQVLAAPGREGTSRKRAEFP